MFFLDLRKPTYVEGIRKPIDSDSPMLDDLDLDHILAQKSFQDLAWNREPEEIGEGRRYIGHWDKKSTAKIKWRGFGIIIFQDGSKYQG